MKANCHYCGADFEMRNGAYNRAMKISDRVFCSLQCVGKNRRNGETPEEKKEIKAWYDCFIRASIEDADLEYLQKAVYFQLDYQANPEKYKKMRRAKQQHHNEYCRQPKYRAYKQEYDKTYHAQKNYGEFAEAAIVLLELEKEIDVRLAKQQNGIINKTQKRKRLWLKMQPKQNLSSTLSI